MAQAPSIAGVSSKIGSFAAAIQSVQGTAASTPTFKAFFASSPSFKLTQTDARYSMTDGTRDQGDPYVSLVSAQGDVELYAHPEIMGTLWRAALGANADTGTNPNYTHTSTPANDLPYLTVWIVKGGGLIIEKYIDVKVSSMSLDGSAGQPLTVTLSMMGGIAEGGTTFLTSDTGVNPVQTAPLIYFDGAGTLLVDTVAYAIHQINVSVNNNLAPFQADGAYLNSVDPGQREISGSYTIRFKDATSNPLAYRTYFYGSSGGTATTTNIGTHALDFKWAKSANLSLDVQVPVARWADLPIAPDPGGSPVEVQVAWEGMRNFVANVESAMMTVVAKDQNATT